jgi:putative DeoR family transcriptional regulator (stage III sporulation protein D)
MTIRILKKKSIKSIFIRQRRRYAPNVPPRRHHVILHNPKQRGIRCKEQLMQGFFMKSYIKERAVRTAHYIIDSKATVRQAAEFGISKSTVHKDVTDRLAQIDPPLAAMAREVLDINKQERHIRGGLATREKYRHN